MTQEIESLASEMLTMKNDEKSVILMLRMFLIFNNIHIALNVPRVVRHRFEYSVEGGRIDLLLFHADESVTIVEAKCEGSLRNIVAGIGQLCLYEARLRRKFRPTRGEVVIHKVLCASYPLDRADDLFIACEAAGVSYAYIYPFKEFKGRIDSAMAKSWVRHGT